MLQLLLHNHMTQKNFVNVFKFCDGLYTFPVCPFCGEAVLDYESSLDIAVLGPGIEEVFDFHCSNCFSWVRSNQVTKVITFNVS